MVICFNLSYFTSYYNCTSKVQFILATAVNSSIMVTAFLLKIKYDGIGLRPATVPQFQRSLKSETCYLTIKITALPQKQPLTSRLGVMDEGSCLVKIQDRDELKN